MLSPLSQNQKDVSEEDSSGSDAGSGVISEPETDRFGFIVTNTSSAGSVGPPPELVRQREAKWINIMTQWECILSKKKNKVKVQCQKGIPASLRAKCWPLLCAATDRMEKNKKLYQSLDLKPALQSWVDVIERDLDRQFPFHEMFLSKDGHGQRGLFRVLKAYTQYQPKDGYCQAQGPVAAVLLMNMPAEEAFWCLVQISEQYLPGYYSPLLEGVLFDAAMLTWVLKRTCPAAHRHLQYYEVEPLMFATDWLMCLFTRHLPFNTLLRVWDLFFCNGVRVLLQVAVVLVRRVLGRTEQRKQCQGQMETLERLRGVREQVQEEDDNFIAEVCSVQLSARDLEKHTEKELEKWRKDRPSSTFDPRHRCMGYQMAWAMALHDQQEREKEEREKGNLSVPLSRSASTLSLSPSVLRKKWKKSGKVNTGERERGAHIVRHLSMGSEDHMRWTEVNFKHDHGVQEEEAVFSEEPIKQMQAKKLDNIQKTPTEQAGKRVKTLSAQVETKTTETKESQFKEPIESKNETQESTPSATKDVTEDHVQPIEQSKQDSDRQLQGLEQESCKNNDQEIEDKNKRTEKQTVDSEPSASVDEIQTEMLKHDDVDINTELEENVPQAQVDSKTEISTTTTTTTETSLHSETDRQDKASTQQPQTEAITEIDNGSQGDTFKRTHHSIESLTETQRSHTQTASEADVLVQTQEEVEESTDAQQAQEAGILPTNLEKHVDSNTETEAVIPYIPECNHVNEDTDLAGDAEAEIPNDTVSELSETFDLCLEASETTEETSGADRDQTKAEEMPTHSETNEGTSDFIASPQDKDNLPTVPDGKTSSVETSTTDEPTPEQSKIQANACAAEEEESPKSVQESAIGNEICDSFEPTDSNTNTNSDPPGGEVSNNGLPQASSRRSSRSSGDFCIRKSSNARGSKLVRRLSEDLFTMPQKPCQSQSLQKRSEVKYTEPRSNPVAVNSTQSHPDMSSEVSSSMTDKKEKQKEPPNHSKGFGLFHRLRGEQAKKTPKQTPKIQVPKILIQDFSDGTGVEKTVKEYKEEKLSTKERKRRQRDRERRAKEEEKMRKQRENEQEKVTDQEKRKVQTIGRSFQVEGEKGRGDELEPAKTQSNVLRYSTSYANSYF